MVHYHSNGIEYYLTWDIRLQVYEVGSRPNGMGPYHLERLTYRLVEDMVLKDPYGASYLYSSLGNTVTDPKAALALLQWMVLTPGVLPPAVAAAPQNTVAGGGSGTHTYHAIMTGPATFKVNMGPQNTAFGSGTQWQVTTSVIDSFEPMPDYSNDLTKMANVIREKTEAMEGMTKEIKELKEEIEDLKKDIQFYKDCEQDRP